MKRLFELFPRFGVLDRRVIFIVLAAAVALPIFLPPVLTARPGEQTIRFNRALDRALTSDKPVMLSINFGPQTIAEMEPQAIAVMQKLFAAGKKVVVLTFLPEAAAPIRRYLGRMENDFDLEYGRDYVFLGYASAYWMAIYNMGTSIEEYFHADDRNTPLAKLPLMSGVNNYDDVAAVIDIASNTMPRYWLTYGQAPYGFDFLMGCTAVQATDYYPYLQTGQVKGLLAGGRAGAEFESLIVAEGVVETTGDATLALGSQSLALFVIIAFIVLGNLAYFWDKKKIAGGTR